MAVHLEFVVLGQPISNQSSSPLLAEWRLKVKTEATVQWGSKKALDCELKAVIINFYGGDSPSLDLDNLSLDLDNLSKPILDVMQGIVYKDDRKIIQAELSHTRISGAYHVGGVVPILVEGLVALNPFVFVRIEDPPEPLPLPGGTNEL